MTHYTEQTGFPAAQLQEGLTLRLRALHPTTDAEVTGVTAAAWAIYGKDDGETIEAEDPIVPIEWLEIPA